VSTRADVGPRRAEASAPATAACLAALVLLSGCVATAPPAPPAAPATPSLVELLERPAERALVDALRAYDGGQYTLAEPSLRQALAAGVANPRDRATAHKLLAFIACTSQRVAACADAFRAARAADPAFALSRAEQGHPMWGPVYRRALGAPAPP
jgi:hypothetical protein